MRDMDLEREILRKLKPHANPKRAAHDVGYLNSQFPTLGVSIPNIRKIAKEIARMYEGNHVQTRNDLSRLWKKSNTHDVLSVPLYYFALRKPENTLADWRTIKTWASRIDNWAHSDVLSDIISDLLERHPREVLPVLKTWNRSRQPWKRRLSLTSLVYYANLRKRVPPIQTILSLVRPCIADDHFYVQRAVGWILREVRHVYPKDVDAFVKKHLSGFSSIAFTTATEKYPPALKERLKNARRQARAAKKNT